MKIISCFVREQRRYTKNELQSLFSFDEQGVEQFIKNLKAYSVLKAVKNNTDQKEMSDLIDEDIEVADETAKNDEFLYVFTYVGVITIGRRIIKVFPKYILTEEQPLDKMKQVLKVLEKYNNSEEQIINIFNGSGDNRSFNILAVILFLMNDYHECGVYNNSENIVEVNGEGSILWRKTIDESFTLFRDNRPYYMEVYTERTIDDDMDYFKRLHECVLTECSKQLEKSQLMDLFEMVSVELSEEKLADFGEKEYILDRIQAELNMQFNTRKQILLKTLYAYISQDRKLLDEEQGISMYGSTAFNMVWERVCAEVFNNKLNTQLGSLGLSAPLADGYNKKTKLIDIIDKPVWYGMDTKKAARETLTPDLIAIGQKNGTDYFMILDAKYYNIQLEKDKNLRGNPGVGDVTKQYLYQLAYKAFIEAHGISVIKNCFLMPIDQDEIVNKGRVSIEMLHNLDLEDIEIRQLPAALMFRHYLGNMHMNIELLKL